MTYQYQWVLQIDQKARDWYSKGIFGMRRDARQGDDMAPRRQGPDARAFAKRVGAGFQLSSSARPAPRKPNKQGCIATHVEWARQDQRRRHQGSGAGQAAYGEKLPDPTKGFNPGRRKTAAEGGPPAVFKGIRERLDKVARSGRRLLVPEARLRT